MRYIVCFLTILAFAFSPVLTLADEDDQAVWQLPDKADELNDLTKVRVQKVEQITGEDSPNQTLSRFQVWGTDLGSMTEMHNKVYMFCGDTFASQDNANWRSNVLFIIEDDDPSDGLTITGAITDAWGKAKELIKSRKIDNEQMTTIPTNIFAIDDTLYCIYMSVRHWHEQGGRWDCGFSGLAKSEDEGQTWLKLTNVQWPGESNFIQTAHCLVGDTLYLWGIPSGRFGGVALMKVNRDNVEEFEEYSYFVGCDETGEPQWVRGSAGIEQAKVIIDEPVGEISVTYNEYLGNFVMTYLDERKGAIVMREGVTPWGEWSSPIGLAYRGQYPSLYGAYMLDKYQENGGQTFYFAMSQYFPIYNVMWMKAELPEVER